MVAKSRGMLKSLFFLCTTTHAEAMVATLLHARLAYVGPRHVDNYIQPSRRRAKINAYPEASVQWDGHVRSSHMLCTIHLLKTRVSSWPGFGHGLAKMLKSAKLSSKGNKQCWNRRLRKTLDMVKMLDHKKFPQSWSTTMTEQQKIDTSMDDVHAQ